MATLRIRKSTSDHRDPKPFARREAPTWLREAMSEIMRYDRDGDFQVLGVTDVQCMRWLEGQGVAAAEVRSTFMVVFSQEDATTRRNIMGYCEL